MELRALGQTGVKVSALCLGTMTFGHEADEAMSKRVVDCFLDAGGNFIDTADVYQEGLAEKILGGALGGKRHKVILATKGRMPMGTGADERGAGRRYLTRAVDASLLRLGTDWIDLYQVHWPDPTVPLEETLSTLNDLVVAGKIRYFGLSNYLGWELQRGIDACDRYGWAAIASHQPQYSLVCREIEFDSLLACRAHDIAVLPWSPLGGGILTGKYNTARTVPPGTRLASPMQARRRLTHRNLQVAEVVASVAAQVGRTPAQVALNWVLCRPGVTAPIVGARDTGQLKENLGAEGWRLESPQLDVLDQASRLPLPYPHDFYDEVLPAGE